MDYSQYKNTEPYGLNDEEKAQKAKEFQELETLRGTKAELKQAEEGLKAKWKEIEREGPIRYNETEQYLESLFWRDAFEELGIPLNHPKADKLKSLAWDHGHSSGYSEVFYWLTELSDLIDY